jgi:hypothetical protein
MNNQPQDANSLDSISLVTQILCFSITSPLIALRIFARLKLHHSFGVEDGKKYHKSSHIFSRFPLLINI